MNVQELIEILRKLPGDMEIMMPLEGNIDRPKAVYIATVAKTRRDWTMATVGNYVVLDNDEVSKREDTTDTDGKTAVINLLQVDTLICRGLTVPVWQAAPGKGHSTTHFVRYSELPADLIEA